MEEHWKTMQINILRRKMIWWLLVSMFLRRMHKSNLNKRKQRLKSRTNLSSKRRMICINLWEELVLTITMDNKINPTKIPLAKPIHSPIQSHLALIKCSLTISLKVINHHSLPISPKTQMMTISNLKKEKEFRRLKKKDRKEWGSCT